MESFSGQCKPLLFVIYVNDLSQHMNGVRVVKLAYDTTFTTYGTNIEDLNCSSNAASNISEKWFNLNNLLLNRGKTQILKIPTNRRLAEGNEVKLLGFTIDDRLSWIQHCENLLRALSSIKLLVRKLRPFVGFVCSFSLEIVLCSAEESCKDFVR